MKVKDLWHVTNLENTIPFVLCVLCDHHCYLLVWSLGMKLQICGSFKEIK